MTNDLTIVPSDIKIPACITQRGINPQQWNALKRILYADASDESVALVLDYCKARGLDPMKRPVWIVQVNGRETIWEGIASLRITAARTGQYAGQDEAIFGPDVTGHVGQCQVRYPEWCKITVYRLVGTHRVAFSARLYWLETFRGTKDGTPNHMWRGRPMHMLEKCTEAAALRKAFPEELGNLPIEAEAGCAESPPQNGENKSRLDVLEEMLVTRWDHGEAVGNKYPVKKNGEVRFFPTVEEWRDVILELFSESGYAALDENEKSIVAMEQRYPDVTAEITKIRRQKDNRIYRTKDDNQPTG